MISTKGVEVKCEDCKNGRIPVETSVIVTCEICNGTGQTIIEIPMEYQGEVKEHLDKIEYYSRYHHFSINSKQRLKEIEQLIIKNSKG